MAFEPISKPSIAELIALPHDWIVTHIIFLDPDWQVNAMDTEYAIITTGMSIEDALTSVRDRIAIGQYNGRVHDGNAIAPKLEFTTGLSLAERLGLVPKTPPITRRL